MDQIMKSNIVQVVNCLCLTVFSTWRTHGGEYSISCSLFECTCTIIYCKQMYVHAWCSAESTVNYRNSTVNSTVNYRNSTVHSTVNYRNTLVHVLSAVTLIHACTLSQQIWTCTLLLTLNKTNTDMVNYQHM